jgi:peptide/nickel transport system substrate-binding protein
MLKPFTPLLSLLGRLLPPVLVSCSRVELPARQNLPLSADIDLAECPPGKTGATFVTANPGEPTSFNPLVIEDYDSSIIMSLTLSGLVGINPVTRDYIPALAKSWEVSADHKTYTFHLRRGLQWSDGAPLTADDVIFTFDCIYDPRYPNRNSQQFTIGGRPLKYEKIDPLTVRFTTPDLYAPFISDLSSVLILPRHALLAAYRDGTLLRQWTVATGINNPSAIVASGPFRIFSYRPGDRLLLVPNPHYWRADADGQRLPYINLYIVKFVKDMNAEIVNFTTGQTESCEIRPADVGWVERAQRAYDFTIYDRGPDDGISFIFFNMNPGKNAKGQPFIPPYKLKWFRDLRFRQAVAYGFNRQGIIDSVSFGRSTVTHSIISQGNFKWHNPDCPQFNYEPAKAERLLAAAGFRKNAQGRLIDADGHPVEFEVLVPGASSTSPQVVTSFAEDMKALGIGVKLALIDFGTMLARINQTYDYDAGIMAFSGGDGDPSGGKAIYRSDGRLHVWNPSQRQPATAWEARVDELMDLQEKVFDYQRRKALVDEIQLILAEQRPLLFLVTPTKYLGIKNRWHNLQKDLQGHMIKLEDRIDEIWADEEQP